MLFAIALGGAAGSVLRHVLGSLLQPRADAGSPSGTLFVNVTGSLLLGFLVHRLAATTVPAELRAALTIGLCGGYTTFSTFSLETIRMIESGRWMPAAAYVLTSVLLSLAAMMAGLMLGRTMVPP